MKKILLVFSVFLSASIATAQEFKFGKVSKEEVKEAFYSKDSTVDAAYLYRYRKTYFEYMESSGFHIVTEYHNRLKIYNKSGLDWAVEEISYYKPDSNEKEEVVGLKGFTFNLENGKVVKEKVVSKEIKDEKKNAFYSVKKVPFPNVKPGSVLDIKYKVVSPYATIIDDLDFQFGIPVKRIDYKVIIPSYFTFSKKNKGYYSIHPKINKVNTSQTITSNVRTSAGYVGASGNQKRSSKLEYFNENIVYQADDVPAISKDEPYVYSLNSYRGGIDFELIKVQFPNSNPKFYSSTWEKISRDIYQSSSFGGELSKVGYFENDLTPILSGSSSSLDKLVRVYQYVKSKVKWNGVYGWRKQLGGKKAFKEGVGSVADINLMLTSMLRFAGLNANPVLVSTKSNGIPVYPTQKGFNYVVSSVTLDNGGVVLLDATDGYLMPNQLPIRAINWNGRMIMKDGVSKWISLKSNKFGIEDHQLSVKLDQEGVINGMFRSKYYNLNAYTFRKSNNHLAEEELISKLEDKHQIEIDNYRLGNKLKLDKAVSQMMKFSTEDWVEVINNKLYVNPLMFLTKERNPFKSNTRSYPVDFISPWKDNFTVSMQLPQGFKVESLPESISMSMDDDLGMFSYKISEVNGVIKATVLVQINRGEITPNYYNVLKEFYAQIIKKQNEKIVLVKA